MPGLRIGSPAALDHPAAVVYVRHDTGIAAPRRACGADGDQAQEQQWETKNNQGTALAPSPD
jgi:hypothetical protein